MTTYGAYNAGLPCKNSNCKSHGKPHPNCRCYGDMAKGGKVGSFCDSGKAHQDDCEYYAEGGLTDLPPGAKIVEEPSAASSDLPPGAVIVDEPASAASDLPPGAKIVEPKLEAPPGAEIVDYSSPSQKILTGIEGGFRGLAGPLATGAELALSKMGIPGLSAEDQTARSTANPEIALGSSMAGLGAGFIPVLAPISLAGKVGKVANLVKIGEEAALAAKFGANALKGAITGGLFQASDEASKAMLGQGDPNEGVAGKLLDAGTNILGAGAVGGLFGLGSSGLSLGLSKAAESKMGTQIQSYLAGIGESAKGIMPQNSVARLLDEKAYDKGVNLWNKKVSGLIAGTSIGTIAALDLKEGFEKGDVGEGVQDAIKDVAYGLGLKFGAGYALKKLSKPAGAFLLKMISNGETNPNKLLQGIDHANRVDSGLQKLNKGVENLFTAGGQQLFNDAAKTVKARERLDTYIEEGGTEQAIQQSIYDQNTGTTGPDSQGFAKGGKVSKPKLGPKDVSPVLQEDHALAAHAPEQDMLINAARGRVSGYLNSLRPQKNQPRLAFDDEPDNRQAAKSYRRALDIANQPLAILDKIKAGTLEPEHVKHFNNLYPEVGGVLQKKLAQKISESQLKGQRPSHRVRQSLSLFMGTALSAELSPQNMMAAQAVFVPKQQQPQGGAATKTSALKSSDDSHLTANQAAAARQQKQS